MRSYQLAVGCNPKTGVFTKKRSFGHRDGEKNIWWQRQRRGGAQGRPRKAEDCLQPSGSYEKARQDSFLDPSDGAWPCQHLDHGQVASKTTSERIRFCCFKPPSLWYSHREKRPQSNTQILSLPAVERGTGPQLPDGLRATRQYPTFLQDRLPESLWHFLILNLENPLTFRVTSPQPHSTTQLGKGRELNGRVIQDLVLWAWINSWAQGVLHVLAKEP